MFSIVLIIVVIVCNVVIGTIVIFVSVAHVVVTAVAVVAVYFYEIPVAFVTAAGGVGAATDVIMIVLVGAAFVDVGTGIAVKFAAATAPLLLMLLLLLLVLVVLVWWSGIRPFCEAIPILHLRPDDRRTEGVLRAVCLVSFLLTLCTHLRAGCTRLGGLRSMSVFIELGIGGMWSCGNILHDQMLLIAL